MMFSKETLSSFTNQYIAARKGNSCVPVFASSAALPETLKEPIVLFLRQYYLDGLRFMYDSVALTPATITSHGGSLLVKYINSLRTHAVLLAPMCQEILQDDELKKNFLAEAPNGHSVRERAWEMQQKNINSSVKNYVMENNVDRLTQENDCLLDQNRMLCKLNQQASTHINDLEDEIKDLRGDNDHLRATINDLHLQEDDLISQVK